MASASALCLHAEHQVFVGCVRGYRNGQPVAEVDSERFAEPSWLETFNLKATTPSCSILQECGIVPFQFNWFRATMRFYNSLPRCNSLLLKKVLHADISLSSRTDSCWTSYLLSALYGLAHSDVMRPQTMACDPVNLSQFVVEVRCRHLGYENQFTAPDPRVNNSKRRTYHQWCTIPVRDAHATHPPYNLPNYMYLDLPHHVLHNIARFRLRFTFFKLNRLFGPIVLLRSVIPVILMTYKMKNMCCSNVPIPRSALYVKSMPHSLSTTSLFYTFISPTGKECYMVYI
eukprot:1161786-Pelagomonas_calceolata.AAC.5